MGHFPTLSVARARELAADILADVRANKADPVEDKREARSKEAREKRVTPQEFHDDEKGYLHVKSEVGNTIDVDIQKVRLKFAEFLPLPMAQIDHWKLNPWKKRRAARDLLACS